MNHLINRRNVSIVAAAAGLFAVCLVVIAWVVKAMYGPVSVFGFRSEGLSFSQSGILGGGLYLVALIVVGVLSAHFASVNRLGVVVLAGVAVGVTVGIVELVPAVVGGGAGWSEIRLGYGLIIGYVAAHILVTLAGAGTYSLTRRVRTRASAKQIVAAERT